VCYYLCPICLKQPKEQKAETFGPLKTMISGIFGGRALMDLVDMHRKQMDKFTWILRCIDQWILPCSLPQKLKKNGGERVHISAVHQSNPRNITIKQRWRNFG
jgi:hypothetical protein